MRHWVMRACGPSAMPFGLFAALVIHNLRHKCATLLHTKNVNPTVVSEMLGHSSIAITLDTYSHVLLNMQYSAARALEVASR